MDTSCGSDKKLIEKLTTYQFTCRMVRAKAKPIILS